MKFPEYQEYSKKQRCFFLNFPMKKFFTHLLSYAAMSILIKSLIVIMPIVEDVGACHTSAARILLKTRAKKAFRIDKRASSNRTLPLLGIQS